MGFKRPVGPSSIAAVAAGSREVQTACRPGSIASVAAGSKEGSNAATPLIQKGERCGSLKRLRLGSFPANWFERSTE